MKRHLLIAAALAALVCAGCGGFGDDDVKERVTGPVLLTKRQVDRQPAGSPQRAIFEWYRALQFKNAIEAAPYYSASLHITPTRLTKILVPAESALAYRPKLVEVDESGDRAIVRLLLEKISKNPNGRVDREQRAQAFNMVREHGSWKLSENLWLGAIYQQYRSFAALAPKQQGSGE